MWLFALFAFSVTFCLSKYVSISPGGGSLTDDGTRICYNSEDGFESSSICQTQKVCGYRQVET